MTQRIPLKVGQVWMLREQRYRVRVTSISGSYYAIQYADRNTGSFEGGETAGRDMQNWNGSGYPNNNGDHNRDMVTLLYCPEGSLNV